MSNTYKDLLVTVSKPSRYMGHEINSVQKDLSEVVARVALIFPDSYEIGMSHLGLKILYHILNNMQGVAAERAFVPWGDMEDVLIKNRLPLSSIETSTPLGEFDILGINLPYELSYTNILTVLSLSGVPFYSGDRGKEFPLIIGGGTAVFNPEPVADFFDAFLIGDGEEAVVEIVNTFNEWKASGASKDSLLLKLSGIEGVYVPSFYSISYNSDGTVSSVQSREGVPDKIKRRIIEDLDRAPFPVSEPLPYMQIVHDRLTVEITRGCTHGCRFCQAGMIYRPVRERSPEKILEIIDASLRNSGFEEVTLSSLSTGDFGCLSDMMNTLLKKYEDQHVAFSLPSLRVETLTPSLIDQITTEKNSSFTVAPEAGTDRLRKVINKEMDEGVFETTVNDVFKRGVKSLKMYFMACLPTEDDDDLQGIINLAKRAKDIARKYGKRGKDITVSVSTFVPKPHTPFQWYGQVPRDEIERRMKYLKAGLYKVGVSFKFHKREMSYFEAVFSRGDRRLSKVIEAAWMLGSRFDSWTDRFDFERWMTAFEQCNIDPDFYASRNIFLDEILPWEHIQTGVTKEFLIKEYNRAVSGRIIPDCRYGDCPNCGVCDMEAVRGRKAEGIRPIARKFGQEEVSSKQPEVSNQKFHTPHSSHLRIR
ncbi:MAG: TIGR03960 family B12-binding radical SAM protein [Nitrospira sp.]|nr:TIGR03960 family B12-binding radical SAM protein [Nitrospira sp.]